MRGVPAAGTCAVGYWRLPVEPVDSLPDGPEVGRDCILPDPPPPCRVLVVALAPVDPLVRSPDVERVVADPRTLALVPARSRTVVRLLDTPTPADAPP